VRRLRVLYGIDAPEIPTRDPVDALVATILAQSTSDVNSGRAMRSLRERYRDWNAVVHAPRDELARTICHGGLANVKARRIQEALSALFAAQSTVGRDGGGFDGMTGDQINTLLTALPGVGPKTAACVLLFSLGMPAVPVDTHVRRVGIRLGILPKGATFARAHALLADLCAPTDAYVLHVGLVRHGRATCVARRPRCEACALNDICADRLSSSGGSRGD